MHEAPPDNPWVLPPAPRRSKKLRRRLLCLSIFCSVFFLVVVFPALLAQNLDAAHTPGWRLLVLSGGAMEPAVRSGALALANKTPFARLRVGDVIVYSTSAGCLHTRRVVSVERGAVVVKGDSALLPESAPVTPERYICRVRKVFNGFAGVARAFG
jgi:signal peptidase I